MESLYNVTLLGLFFGIIGTTLGGFVGVFINFKSNKFISIILELAAGLMTSIICFDLIPHSLMFISITNLIFEILLGIIIMIYCNNFVNKKIVRYNVSSNLLKVGIVVGIGLAIHNFPEGLAIGAGFEASSKLGFVPPTSCP